MRADLRARLDLRELFMRPPTVDVGAIESGGAIYASTRIIGRILAQGG